MYWPASCYFAVVCPMLHRLVVVPIVVTVVEGCPRVMLVVVVVLGWYPGVGFVIVFVVW